MDGDGYPDESELEHIRTMKIHGPRQCADLIKYVRDKAWNERYGQVQWSDDTVIFVTGGWSGNEDALEAMGQNAVFWYLCWQKSERGGLHVFKLPNGWSDSAPR